MSLQYDDKLADLLINGGLRASKEGRQTIDAGALLREAGEAASLPAPEPLEEGDIKCSPVLTEEIKECLEEAVNASSSGMAGVDDFLIALCGSAKNPRCILHRGGNREKCPAQSSNGEKRAGGDEKRPPPRGGFHHRAKRARPNRPGKVGGYTHAL